MRPRSPHSMMHKSFVVKRYYHGPKAVNSNSGGSLTGQLQIFTNKSNITIMYSQD